MELSVPHGKLLILSYILLCTVLTIIGYSNIVASAKPLEIMEPIEATRPAGNFIIDLIIATAFLLLVFKFIHHRIITLLFELVMVMFPSMIFMSAMLLPVFQNDLMHLYFLSGVIALGIFISKQLFQKFKDAVTIITASGIAIAIVSSFTPASIILVSLFLMAYDVVAVFVTKHMVFFAKKIVAYNLPMTVTARVGAEELGDGQSYFAHAHETEKQSPVDSGTAEKAVPAGQNKKLSRIDLGSGDLIMFAVMSTTNLALFGVPGLALSIIFGTVAVYAMLVFVMRRRMVFPALLAIIPAMLLVTLLLYAQTIIAQA